MKVRGGDFYCNYKFQNMPTFTDKINDIGKVIQVILFKKSFTVLFSWILILFLRRSSLHPNFLLSILILLSLAYCFSTNYGFSMSWSICDKNLSVATWKTRFSSHHDIKRIPSNNCDRNLFWISWKEISSKYIRKSFYDPVVYLFHSHLWDWMEI